jgi:isoquinoline 1-oxidoreductase
MNSTPFGSAYPKLEPERYELASPPAYRFQTNRREFVKLLGGGIVVVWVLKDVCAAQESGGLVPTGSREGRRGFGESPPQEICAWLRIGEDGAVTVYTGKVEVGQNTRTALTQAVAEELRVPPNLIRMVMGDTDLTPFDMGTFGSRSTPIMSPLLRRAGAAAREMLIDLAAARWKTERSGLVAADGRIIDSARQRALAYGDLVKGQNLTRTIAADQPLTPGSEWKVMAQSLPKANGRDFVTGRHRYTSDVKLPNMLYGKVLRPGAFGATLASLDAREAKAMPGVTVVQDGDFVGVAAPSPELAARALAALRVEWKTSPQPSGRELFEDLKRSAEQSSGLEDGLDHSVGSLDRGRAEATHRLETTYNVAYIAHAPLEPRAAVAEWSNGKLAVWTGTQRPFGVRSELAQVFRLPEDHVRVQVPDTGGACGGKHMGEAAVEAARLARTAGRPVKLVWSREEEFTWAYFRPAGVIDVAGYLRDDGAITAWEFHNYNSGAAAIRTPYDIPNQHIRFHPVKAPLRQGSYRALAATANHFARESHMYDLARLVRMDPLAFRLKNLKDARLRSVFEAAARTFGWGRPKTSKGQGFGIAGGVEKGGYVATCAEISVGDAGKVRVVRVVTAFDCGAVINPEQLRNQIEGATVMGIGGALFEAIEFENGRILNGRFSRYRVPRFSDLPSIETVLVDRKDQPSAGAGETPMVGLAPAVGNGIFDATGVRLRSLPMAANGVKL